MPLKSETREVGGFTYHATQLPAMRAEKLWARLVRVFGPALAEVFAGVESLEQMNLVGVAPALRDLFTRLTEEERTHILREVLGSVEVEEGGRRGPLWPVVDAHFTGRLKDLYAVAWFALEVNFSDFFDGLGEKLGALLARVSSTGASTTSSMAPGAAGTSS